jgi:hypothetical protein
VAGWRGAGGAFATRRLPTQGFDREIRSVGVPSQAGPDSIDRTPASGPSQEGPSGIGGVLLVFVFIEALLVLGLAWAV